MSELETRRGAAPRNGPSDDDLRRAVPRGAGGREVQVGIFVLVGVLSALFALFLLTDPATFRGRYMLATEVADAGGLRKGDPVQMRGVNVGRVHDFGIDGQGVRITMEIEGQWQVPADSRVRLVGVGLLGGRTVEVTPGDSPLMAAPGDLLPGDSGDDVAALAENIGTQAEAALGRVQALLSEGTVTSVQASAEELRDLLTELAALTREQRSEVARLTTSLNATAEDVRGAASAAAPDLASAAARADSTLARLTVASESLEGAASSLQTILDRINRGEGTLGRLAQDDALYTNLNAAVTTIQELAADIREHPGRYISLKIF